MVNIQLAVTLMVTFAGLASAATYQCSIGKYGKMEMFTGEKGNVELPCKYILTEMTCGDWNIKVTGGSSSDPDKIFRYSPDTIWVKVEGRENNKRFVARTSVSNFEDKKYVFNVMDDLSNYRPKKWNYYPYRKGAIVAETGQYEIYFGMDRTIRITCRKKNFANTPYPESLCGDGNRENMNVIGRDRRALFYGSPITIERSYGLTYHILNNSRVTQSTQCSGIARKFQRCARDGFQAEAIARCARTFSDRSVSGCLNTSPDRVNAFRLCIKFTGCNRDDTVSTGPAAVCQFFKDQFTQRSCESEAVELAQEMPDCAASMSGMGSDAMDDMESMESMESK